MGGVDERGGGGGEGFCCLGGLGVTGRCFGVLDLPGGQQRREMVRNEEH